MAQKLELLKKERIWPRSHDLICLKKTLSCRALKKELAVELSQKRSRKLFIKASLEHAKESLRFRGKINFAKKCFATSEEKFFPFGETFDDFTPWLGNVAEMRGLA